VRHPQVRGPHYQAFGLVVAVLRDVETAELFRIRRHHVRAGPVPGRLHQGIPHGVRAQIVGFGIGVAGQLLGIPADVAERPGDLFVVDGAERFLPQRQRPLVELERLGILVGALQVDGLVFEFLGLVAALVRGSGRAGAEREQQQNEKQLRQGKARGHQ
jgi:hypothetical protein